MANDEGSYPPKLAKVVQLSPGELFSGLDGRTKFYAHHMARAAWQGTRIILRQVSPESIYIFDFIMELYGICGADWDKLRRLSGLSDEDMHHFLEYAATFLQSVGNYYGHGDQKFVPGITKQALAKLSLASTTASKLYSQMDPTWLERQPSRLGYTSAVEQTSYYIGSPMSENEVATISSALLQRSIDPENTRIRKRRLESGYQYDILQASVESEPIESPSLSIDRDIACISRGDHGHELKQICDSLAKAQNFTANITQQRYLASLIKSFESGDMEKYKEAQELWIEDTHPNVETVIGFVEPYRDPYGARAEFEGLVGVQNPQETRLLNTLIENADRIIATLPWVDMSEQNGSKGPFELAEMGFRDFTSVYTLAYCSTLIFPGINLPNYNDIRQTKGSKNIMISNAIDGGSMSSDSGAEYIHTQEKQLFLEHRRQTYYLWVVFHELFGHGTGRFLEESEPGVFNFDINRPPINPLTGKPIESWYRPHETWTELFGDLSTTVDECRAECVGAYLLSNKELCEICGFNDSSVVTSSDLEYNMYLQLAISGLRSLESYSEDGRKWGQAHSRGHFAMFRTLLEDCGDFMTIRTHQVTQDLTISVDKSKIASHGVPALSTLLMRLHIFRCTADVKGCRQFYERLTEVHEPYSGWRKIVLAKKPAIRIFVQPNTFIDGDEVVLKEYPATYEGMIESWAERSVAWAMRRNRCDFRSIVLP